MIRLDGSAVQPTAARPKRSPAPTISNADRRLGSIPPTTTSTSTRATRSSLRQPAAARGPDSSAPDALQLDRRRGGVDGNARRHHTTPSGSQRRRLRATRLPPDDPIDNPAVVHGVSDAGDPRHRRLPGHARRATTRVFASTLPLTGYDNAGHREVFRYDAAERARSTAPPATRPTRRRRGDATWPRNGLSLTDDGRVFFNSTEPLVAARPQRQARTPTSGRDGRTDPSLISTGTSPLRLEPALGVSADGIDAYFFTRDILVPEDDNGSR